MKVGDLVMLIGTDGFMPNLGAVGEIVSPFDGEDFEVHFPAWPCPVGDPLWFVPPSMLMLIPRAPIPDYFPAAVEPCQFTHTH